MGDGSAAGDDGGQAEGNLCVDTKLTRERRVEKIYATAVIRTSTTKHTEWFNQASTRGNAGKQSRKLLCVFVLWRVR